MHLEALDDNFDDCHAHGVERIRSLLQEAAGASTFEDAGRALAQALGILEDGLDRRPGLPRRALKDDDSDRLLEAVDHVTNASAGWPAHPYESMVAAGLDAFAEQILRWSGETVATPAIDTNQRARILRNAAHNAAMTKEINGRVHARRNRNVVNLLEYKAGRQRF